VCSLPDFFSDFASRVCACAGARDCAGAGTNRVCDAREVAIFQKALGKIYRVHDLTFSEMCEILLGSVNDRRLSKGFQCSKQS